jgi:hypothetical protein
MAALLTKHLHSVRIVFAFCRQPVCHEKLLSRAAKWSFWVCPRATKFCLALLEQHPESLVQCDNFKPPPPEAPTISKQLAHRWRWGHQSHTPAGVLWMIMDPLWTLADIDNKTCHLVHRNTWIVILIEGSALCLLYEESSHISPNHSCLLYQHEFVAANRGK